MLPVRTILAFVLRKLIFFLLSYFKELLEKEDSTLWVTCILYHMCVISHVVVYCITCVLSHMLSYLQSLISSKSKSISRFTNQNDRDRNEIKAPYIFFSHIVLLMRYDTIKTCRWNFFKFSQVDHYRKIHIKIRFKNRVSSCYFLSSRDQ